MPAHNQCLSSLPLNLRQETTAMADAISRQASRASVLQRAGGAPLRPFSQLQLGESGRLAVTRRQRHQLQQLSAISFRAAGYQPRQQDLPHGAPTLVGRHISLNPLDTAATLLDSTFHSLDLSLAAALDRQPGLTWVAVLGNGAAAAAGLSLYQQAASGLPAWLGNALEDHLGALLMGVPRLLLLLAALPLALWHLRTWWEANTEAARELIGGPLDQKLTTGAITVAVLRLLPLAAGLQAALSGAPQLSGLLLLASLVPLAAAAFTSSGAEQQAAKQPQQAAESCKAALPLLLPLLAADAAFLAAAVACSAASQVAAAACGVAFAAALAVVVAQERYTDRMHAWRAGEGDSADVHITIKAEFGAVVDSSAAKEPVHIIVGQVTAGLEEAAAPSAAAGVAGALSIEGARGTARFCTPAFAALLDELVPGLVVGERASVMVHNPLPREGGFVNPDLVWWQAREDLQTKFKGEVPKAGQVFWFPLGPGANDNWAPVRVSAINDSFAELDGNESIEDAAMLVEVQLVKLTKKQ